MSARLYIAATHKSSGKTTVSLGLCAALSARGTTVQPFKKGPDYIDPIWLGQAAGRACYTLDFYSMAPDSIETMFVEHDPGTEGIRLIEGNKGLFDGVTTTGGDDNAALAKALRTPVVLVVDCNGMTRGIAPLLQGYVGFDPDLQWAGVILNRVGGSRHGAKLRAAVETYTDLKVLGEVSRDPKLQIEERHLGLIPANEASVAEKQIAYIRDRIAAEVDLDAFLQAARNAPPMPDTNRSKDHTTPLALDAPAPLRLAIARDGAFGFYYPADLEAFAKRGVELCYFSPLHDTELPECDALFLGGGFPETHMLALEANRSMRDSIHAALEQGLPAYAECGGLMYLSRSIRWGNEQAAMVGFVPGDTVMQARPQGRGYIRLQRNLDHPWPQQANTPQTIPGHEFHYSHLENLPEGLTYAWNVERGQGLDGRHDGLVLNKLVAGYAHLRQDVRNPWIDEFLAFVHRSQNTTHDATASNRTLV
jgi:cobyrinic acid a,c-diamide synthase